MRSKNRCGRLNIKNVCLHGPWAKVLRFDSFLNCNRHVLMPRNFLSNCWRPLDDVDLTGAFHVQVKLRWLRGLLLDSISNRTPGWARIEAQRGVAPPVD